MWSPPNPFHIFKLSAHWGHEELPAPVALHMLISWISDPDSDTYFQWQGLQPLGVHAHVGLPCPQGIHVAEVALSPANLHPPTQRPVPEVCLEHRGLTPQNHLPTVSEASPVKLGGKACPGASWGVTEKTGRNGKIVMPGTGACPRTAFACGSLSGWVDLQRGRRVPGCRRESDQSAGAGRTQHRPSRTAGGHRCR